MRPTGGISNTLTSACCGMRWRFITTLINLWDIFVATSVLLTNNRKKKIILLCLGCALLFYIIVLNGTTQLGHVEPWVAVSLPPPNGHIHRHYRRARDQELYIYSAIANPNHPVSREVNIVFTVMDQARSKKLDCCVLLDNRTLFTAPAENYFYYQIVEVPVVADVDEYMHPEAYLARQYSCAVPDTGGIHYATLTSSACSSDPLDYVAVYHPPIVPGGVALCGKIAYGGDLDPEKLIEWFEVQRVLGVDQVVIYDFKNPEPVLKVFRYYQRIGFLTLQPYELPGRPYNRSMNGKFYYQWLHDKSLAVLECGQRMSGYTYVMSHDMDEFIVPRQNIGLKHFFADQLLKHQDSAGFFFYAEFFIYGWGPTNPEEDMMLTRYRMTTKPHWECTKFVMMPYRVLSISTHKVFPLSGYTTYKISAQEAVLHHYRQCPSNVWKTCEPVNTIVDDIMTRYKDIIYPKVLGVRNEVGLQVTWGKN